jgi:hypothetical protein
LLSLGGSSQYVADQVCEFQRDGQATGVIARIVIHLGQCEDVAHYSDDVGFAMRALLRSGSSACRATGVEQPNGPHLAAACEIAGQLEEALTLLDAAA